MQTFFENIWLTISQKYWPDYFHWLTVKLSNYNPFGVLMVVAFVAVFLFVIIYFMENRNINY